MAGTSTTMTTKGQVTVPREIRDHLGLGPGDKMSFTMLGDGAVVMRPKTRRLAELAGLLMRPDQPREAVAEMSPFGGATVPQAARPAKTSERPARDDSGDRHPRPRAPARARRRGVVCCGAAPGGSGRGGW